MKILFLGTGTSSGVPLIRCDCAVCKSADPRNRRRRTSLYIRGGGVHVVVDTPPDFREQALAYDLPRVDAVLFTHSHADHVFGLDDVRRFNTVQEEMIPAYGDPATIADLRRIFDYIGTAPQLGLYRPLIDFRSVAEPFAVGGLRITPLPVRHDGKPTFGYMVQEGERRIGYVPDCAGMDDGIVAALRGADVMILDALRHRPHRTHLTVEESVGLLRKIRAERSYLVHLAHDLDHVATEAALPPNIRLSYDGLELEV
jgi:phosphoribosyl 1,2-cyclic phosphate phosphodiesterase